ncbi:MAG: hypothetical protein ABJF11_07365 [Reichenbachiella sp.]|uniref:hypothetical protein n=1 Tax=Reichenbachiella sp. TaxID=2184521 RepID=UPI0032675F23
MAHRTIIFLSVYLSIILSSISIAAPLDSSQVAENGPTEFDFLIGEWKITNKILKQRLSNSDEWVESTALSRCWKILDGFGNIDELEMESREGKMFKGNTIRIYDPSRNEWTLYWVDNWNLHLGVTKQTTGSFENGVGIFYGQEEFQDKTVRQKFTWKSLGNDKVYWDQSYYDEESQQWEVNWIMYFDRIED